MGYFNSLTSRALTPAGASATPVTTALNKRKTSLNTPVLKKAAKRPLVPQVGGRSLY